MKLGRVMSVRRTVMKLGRVVSVHREQTQSRLLEKTHQSNGNLCKKVLFPSNVGHKLFHKLKPLVTVFKE